MAIGTYWMSKRLIHKDIVIDKDQMTKDIVE